MVDPTDSSFFFDADLVPQPRRRAARDQTIAVWVVLVLLALGPALGWMLAVLWP